MSNDKWAKKLPSILPDGYSIPEFKSLKELPARKITFGISADEIYKPPVMRSAQKEHHKELNVITNLVVKRK